MNIGILALAFAALMGSLSLAAAPKEPERKAPKQIDFSGVVPREI